MQKGTRNIYDEYADSWWDDSKRFHRLLARQVFPRLEYFDRIVPEWKGLDVLDLGCGGGFMSEALAYRGSKVIGLDPSRISLNAAHEHACKTGLNITYINGVGEDVPFPADSFDCVVCVDVLEHVLDIQRTLKEIRRVLRPGGIFFFDTVNRTALSRLLTIIIAEDVFRLIPKGTHNYKMYIRPEEMRQHLDQAGFVCSKDFIGMGPFRLNRRLDFEFILVKSTSLIYLGHAW